MSEDGPEPVESPAPFDVEANEVSHGIVCDRCGYDLRGLKPTGDCPECGYDIGETLHAAFEAVQWTPGRYKMEGLGCLTSAGLPTAFVFMLAAVMQWPESNLERIVVPTLLVFSAIAWFEWARFLVKGLRYRYSRSARVRTSLVCLLIVTPLTIILALMFIAIVT